MVKILLALLLTSVFLASCTKELTSPTTGTGEILKQDVPSQELPPSVPEATVIKTPATPVETDSLSTDWVTPESPASDVVTPIGNPE